MKETVVPGRDAILLGRSPPRASLSRGVQTDQLCVSGFPRGGLTTRALPVLQMTEQPDLFSCNLQRGRIGRSSFGLFFVRAPRRRLFDWLPSHDDVIAAGLFQWVRMAIQSTKGKVRGMHAARSGRYRRRFCKEIMILQHFSRPIKLHRSKFFLNFRILQTSADCR